MKILLTYYVLIEYNNLECSFYHIEITRFSGFSSIFPINHNKDHLLTMATYLIKVWREKNFHSHWVSVFKNNEGLFCKTKNRSYFHFCDTLASTEHGSHSFWKCNLYTRIVLQHFLNQIKEQIKKKCYWNSLLSQTFSKNRFFLIRCRNIYGIWQFLIHRQTGAIYIFVCIYYKCTTLLKVSTLSICWVQTRWWDTICSCVIIHNMEAVPWQCIFQVGPCCKLTPAKTMYGGVSLMPVSNCPLNLIIC